MPENYNENTRVQLPAMMHLLQLGYQYYGKLSTDDARKKYDPETNILLDVFKEQFCKLNPGHEGEFIQVMQDIRRELDNDDLGKEFYFHHLVNQSPIKLIDFDNIDNNTFHFTAEFTCSEGGEEFRPDITLFINGLPLCFIEVKKPDNTGGMREEAARMNKARFPMRQFRRFINITQLMIFSNNKEIDTLGGITPVDGSFYCTAAREKAKFNCFREENRKNEHIAPYIKDYTYEKLDPNIERKILFDYNSQVLRATPEYQTNLGIDTPTNRMITSMCSKERLLFLIKYGIAYVRDQREVDGELKVIDEKQIMRYQQMFAALAIRDKIDHGMNSGVLWHTQGSGKTALAYYLSQILTDHFAKNNKVAKFYFIVDRIDLLQQSSQEFAARGLKVIQVSSKAELMKQFRNAQSLEGDSGQREIVVVNIQKFAEDKGKVDLPKYDLNLQRVFIVDEAHRGYKPEGTFLGNLFDADRDAVKIALTGTPLLKDERASWKIFGNYYHTYYYDKSIEDGYTLRVIREPIETTYKERLSEIYERLESLSVKRKELKREDIVEHDSYVKELLRYIINDFNSFRSGYIDADKKVPGTLMGGMIVAETPRQAKRLHELFDKVQDEINQGISDESQKSRLKAEIIVHDVYDKERREEIIRGFKKEYSIDILIVFNMLLTGFDAPRLKRLYLGRQLRDHTLLQAITRVNRPFSEMHYGYVIDFADIKKNFDETNAAYLAELNRFNDPEGVDDAPINVFASVIEDKDELIKTIKEAEDVIFPYDTDNAEEFRIQISAIEDKDELLKIKKALITIRDGLNIGRTFGDEDLRKKLESLAVAKLPLLISNTQSCIDNINLKHAIQTADFTRRAIDDALSNISFKFTPQMEEELRIVDGLEDLDNVFGAVCDCFATNTDQEDPEYVNLKNLFIERMKTRGFQLASTDDYKEQLKFFSEMEKKLREIQRKNEVIAKRYRGDVKFARIHKRIVEENRSRKNKPEPCIISESDTDIFDVLMKIKSGVDEKVYDRNSILKQDAYFEQTVMEQITNELDELNLKNTTRSDRQFLQRRIVSQYMDQYRATYPNG